jgi:hypothetical protein
MKRQCIRTSLEYQILDMVRLKLQLPLWRLEAPRFEVNKFGHYVRYCRLSVRQRDTDHQEMPGPLYLGLDLSRSALEVYFIDCLYRTKKGNYRRYHGNYVYGMANLCDPKSLTVGFLNNLFRKALQQVGQWSNCRRPLLKVAMAYPSIGPYVWTPDLQLDRERNCLSRKIG